MEAELDVSVVEHVPFCKTIGDELTDVLHHERFGGISVKEPSDCVRHGLCAAKPSSARICVEVAEQNGGVKPFSLPGRRAGEHRQLPTSARQP
jgi:hypothetical protein